MAGLGCAVVLAAAVAPAGGHTAPHGSRADAPIGSARMEADGTLVLDLIARADDGTVGHGQLRYPPSDPDYPMVAAHLGPIPPGGEVIVRPFPERAAGAGRPAR